MTSSLKPTMLPSSLSMAAIPADLRDAKRWVCWGPDKAPQQAEPDVLVAASSTAARTWTTFERATECAEMNRALDGIGFVLGDGFAGVDLDNCRDPESGEVAEWATEIVALVDSYCEVSPSGTGLHIILRGTLPKGVRHKIAIGNGGAIEAYDRARYFCMTGQRHGDGATVEERTSALATLAARYLTKKSKPPSTRAPSGEPLDVDDATLLDLARASAHGAEFVALYDHGDLSGCAGDHSSADLALCNRLAFWCGPDPARIERLFTASALCREKWTERPDYRERTIGEALAGRTEFFHPGGNGVVKPVTVAVEVKPTTAPSPRHLTDLGNAERLVDRFGADLRYADLGETWFVWDGQRWAPDATREVIRLATESARSIYGEAHAESDPDRRKAIAKHALASESNMRINAAISLARADRRVAVTRDIFDRDQWLLTVENGTLDLRTAQLLPHTPEHFITKLAPVAYDPMATSPLWHEFLARVTDGDDQLGHFLQQVAGYCLTGSTREEKLFFVHGPAASGKSTFLEALRGVLGDYATQADFSAFLAKQPGGGHSSDIARLAGARLVTSIEVDRGARLAEGLVKHLTGGDRVAASFKYRDTFEFDPCFKLLLSANDRPKVRHDDMGLWRRILEVPFPISIPEGERDPSVKTRLRDPDYAGSAILSWMVFGCLNWQATGLRIPSRVRAATDEYRREQDPLGPFLDECCSLDPSAQTPTEDLWAAYLQWADGSGIRFRVTRQQLGKHLDDLGCAQHKGTLGRRFWRGIRLPEGVAP